MRSRFEPAVFRFPDLPEREAGALLIWPPQLVRAGKGRREERIENPRDGDLKLKITIKHFEYRLLKPGFIIKQNLKDFTHFPLQILSSL